MKLKKILQALPLVLALLPTFAIPSFALAATVNNNVWNPTILAGPLVVCTGNLTNVNGGQASNPCTSLCDLIAEFAQVTYFMIGVVIWILAPIMIAWAGISMLMARGNPEKASQARKMVTAVVVGLLIVLCAYLIVYTFVSILNSIPGSTFGNYVGGFGGNAACVP